MQRYFRVSAPAVHYMVVTSEQRLCTCWGKRVPYDSCSHVQICQIWSDAQRPGKAFSGSGKKARCQCPSVHSILPDGTQEEQLMSDQDTTA